MPIAPITIRLPASLRAYCNLPASELGVTAATVHDALSVLEREHPALHRAVCDESGRLRRHVGLFVNASHVRDLDGGLQTALAPGDVITLMPAVSGG